MKNLKIISALIFSLAFFHAGATVYYISNTTTGRNNSNAGTSQAAPWASLSKLLSYDVDAGDQVLLKAGDVFTEMLPVRNGGNANSRVYLGRYGTGANPKISGFSNLSGWTSLGGNIWEADCSAGESLNMVTIGGVAKAMGRWPNAGTDNGGFLTIDSHTFAQGGGGVSSGTITDAQLVGTWTAAGTEVVMRSVEWVLDRNLVTGQSGTTLSYVNPTDNHQGNNGMGYFIQNNPATLDVQGEWYYDAARSKLMLYTTVNPSTLSVKAAVLDDLINTQYRNYVSINSIDFEGADTHGMFFYFVQGLRVENCNFTFSGRNHIRTETFGGFILHNTFNQCNNTSVDITSSDHTNVSYNNIKNSGLLPGMGMSNNQQMDGIYQGEPSKTGFTFEYNRIDSVGYCGITARGDSIVLRYNYISNFCRTIADGGAIYSNGDHPTFRLWAYNIVVNGYGNPWGAGHTTPGGAVGMYTDDLSQNTQMYFNTVANTSRSGVLLHNSQNMTLQNNTFFNNNPGISYLHDDFAPDEPTTGMNIQNNIFFSATNKFYDPTFEGMLAEHASLLEDHNNMGLVNKNFYVAPFHKGGVIYISDQAKQTYYDFDGWRTVAPSLDMQTNITPMRVAPYQITSTIGSNVFPNGSFTSNTNGFDLSSQSVTVSLESGVLDGNALKLAPTGNTQSKKYMFIDFNGVSGLTYLVKFSLVGSNGLANLETRVARADYFTFTPKIYFPLSQARQECEFLFTATSTGVQKFGITVPEANLPLWIDNFDVRQVTATVTNPADVFRLEINPDSTSKTIALPGVWRDPQGAYVTGSITLAPYRSRILIKVPETVLSFPMIIH